MNKKLVFLLLLFTGFNAEAQKDLSYFLPTNVKYNPEIPEPSSVIGHEVGEWHITHDRLVYYMKALADQSDRASLVTYGYTHEGRPLVLLAISSASNQERLEEIRKNHIDFSSPPKEDDPVVIWMGYSVHGNEPSGSNASMLMAYYLTAAESPKIEKQLENCVILIDPSINPDGLQRFANWVNSNKSHTPMSDPNNREHNEFWPKGRTNHYGFDLNRDWLLVQQPESQSRLVKFHEWMPNIVTDHHEMKPNRTFFFQPGIPSRNNPLSPAGAFELTKEISYYHAEFLDSIGSLYYTEESFDDFYFGKGSTYPDVNGGVGILFEQASSRGHLRETSNGLLEFPFTIRNQFVTSLSTLEAGYEMRLKLLNHQYSFYKDHSEGAYLFSDGGDQGKIFHFLEILGQHNINVRKLEKDYSGKVGNYAAGHSYMISLDQPQHQLIEALFETRTSFTDSLFYDISAWTLPLAFNLEYSKINAREAAGIKSSSFASNDFSESEIIGGESDYAYVFEWNEYYAPRLLYRLLDSDYRVRLITNEVQSNGKTFARGSILIPVEMQKEKENLHQDLLRFSKGTGVKIHAIQSGYTEGVSLGSPSIKPLKKPSIALIVEDGASAYETAEIWHLLDHRYQIPITRIPVRVLNTTDLSQYTTLIMVSGSYQQLNSGKIKRWIANGGNFLVFRKGINWVNENKIVPVELARREKDSLKQELPMKS